MLKSTFEPTSHSALHANMTTLSLDRFNEHQSLYSGVSQSVVRVPSWVREEFGGGTRCTGVWWGHAMHSAYLRRILRSYESSQKNFVLLVVVVSFPKDRNESCQSLKQVGLLHDRWRHHLSSPPQFRHGTGKEGNVFSSPLHPWFLLHPHTRISNSLI
ncbi:hypothetical protein TNCV_1874531 [Trichonephila clavipes]|nr:hypothetical protein TNCV_1874531 [Trichonephila clavipes]